MQVIKKTKDFIVIKSSNGTCMKLTNSEQKDLLFKLELVTMTPTPNGTVDGRRGKCLTETEK